MPSGTLPGYFLSFFESMKLPGSSYGLKMNEKPPICNYEGSDYQTSFWEEGGRAYEDACEVVALKRLLPDKGRLMLELGAGAGRNTKRYKGYDQVVLLDYSRTQLAQAKQRLGSNLDIVTLQRMYTSYHLSTDFLTAQP